jgi:amino acid transporter
MSSDEPPEQPQVALDDSDEEDLNAERSLLSSGAPTKIAPDAAPKREKSLSIVSLIAMVFFLVCGGSYGTEDLGGAIPPLFAILGIVIVPWLFSLPIALMTAEMATAMTNKGGFIVWIREGWGDFMSILDACLVTFIVMMDQALYPIIYLGYIKALMPGLGYFEGYAFCVAFIVLACVINLLGVGIVGHGSKIFSLLTLAPFVVFIILGFACGHFNASKWFSTEGEWDIALYLSVLLWANCGYEYSGFVASTFLCCFPALIGAHELSIQMRSRALARTILVP